MYKFHIEEMADNVMEKLNLLDVSNREKILSGLQEYWNDKVAMIWTIYDIQEYAMRNDDLEISDEDARNILNDIFDNHDAEYGINWITIDCYISDFMEERNLTQQPPPDPLTC